MKIYLIQKEVITDTRMAHQDSFIEDEFYLVNPSNLREKVTKKFIEKWGVSWIEFNKHLPLISKIGNQWSYDFLNCIINVKKIVTADN